MEIPLLINGEEVGSVRVTRSGLYTVFEAELPGSAAELVRLWAHGKGKGAYLGVMQPGEGGLCFSRKLSRRELAAFPEAIEFVSDRKEESTEDNLHNTRSEADNGEDGLEKGSEASETEQDPVEDEIAAALPQTDYSACPWPAEPAEEGLLWYQRPDGSLVSFDGISTLLALPAEMRKPTLRGAERVIEGKKYLVFRT